MAIISAIHLSKPRVWYPFKHSSGVRACALPGYKNKSQVEIAL